MGEDIAGDVGHCACGVLEDIDRDGNCAGLRGRSRSSGRKGGEGDGRRESLEFVSADQEMVDRKKHVHLRRASSQTLNDVR